ncbi:hypothetical protein CSC94_22445 [Zhengella mangrovi]|uniref:Ferredoxin n=1 Tax=Zhengella mangrovi TaxID=1982044 RepID=A0A2G1QH36_9HYPH|nr:ferredoxin [Zhengella mangrovi]PHP64835.1 hypothetical protein CSC94_22445 [Zhengella mangrovi]
METKRFRARVNPDLCVGSTMCILEMPDAFRMRADGHAEFVGDALDPDTVRDVAELCPVSAIELINED